MADKVTTSKVLSMVAKFKDGDTRTLTLDNPIDDLTAAQINALNEKAEKVIIGDKTGADFHEFDTAKVTAKETINLDLTL